MIEDEGRYCKKRREKKKGEEIEKISGWFGFDGLVFLFVELLCC